MTQPDRYAHAKIDCSCGTLHEICVHVEREVPKELRCAPSAPAGFGHGNGRGCRIPSTEQLIELIRRELRDNFMDATAVATGSMH